MNNNVALLIPAYNPPEGFARLIDKLYALDVGLVVIVDDGSDQCLDEQLRERPHLVCLRHPANRGKGAALKTGFAYIAAECSEISSVVTVDADGQHLPDDVKKLVQNVAGSPEQFYLGVRDFDTDVPLRSALGNTVMRKLFNSVTDTELRDTQTGLRAYPLALALSCCEIRSDRYDFEMQSLMLALKKDIPIEQLPITTLYEDGNPTSHFRPLVDSMRVVAVLIRFLMVSLTSFLIDISAFALLYSWSDDVIVSTYIARFLSATINFTANKLLVFKSYHRRRAIFETLGYVALALVIASLSAFLVREAMDVLGGDAVLIKVAVDGWLFLISFLVQRYLIFPAANGMPVYRIRK